MLSNREISENFEVQINTLYNWRKSKPKLYKYLRNADYNFEQSKEINVLLERFAKEITGTFTAEEILFFVTSDVQAHSIEDIDHIDRLFILAHQKVLHKEGEFLLTLYDKLHAMGVIEKYIFYKRAHHLRTEQEQPDIDKVHRYFAEFILSAKRS